MLRFPISTSSINHHSRIIQNLGTIEQFYNFILKGGGKNVYTPNFFFICFGILITSYFLASCAPVDPCEGIDCGEHGTCVEGICECDNGYTGETCEYITGPMAQIPAGCFDMGDAFAEGYSNELPVHEVCISAFEMDIHAVTNAEYAECVDGGGCSLPSSTTKYDNHDYTNHPVVYVNWYQVDEYCTWAGKRLPTEAEFEYAARGGLVGARYPWGDTVSGTDANYYNSGDPWDNDTSPVGYYAPNGYGLYDMAGNVLEWVADWYQSDYYTVSPVNDPTGPATGTYRVLRGGSWNYNPSFLRAAIRASITPGIIGSYYIGARCAR